MYGFWLNVCFGCFALGVSCLVGVVFYAASTNAWTANAYHIPEGTKRNCLVWFSITGVLFIAAMFCALVAIAARTL